MSEYGVESLEVLSPQAHVRLRRGMYIGDATNPSPLFNEILDNALDEAQAGFSLFTDIFVNYELNEYTVVDYGRGFPQGLIHDPNSGRDIEALELLCTTPFSGGKFNNSAYRLSGGLHGVGLLVTNSLSRQFAVKTWRDTRVVEYFAQRGDTLQTKTYTEDRGESAGSGTSVLFSPDPEIFEDVKIPLNHIVMRCRIASAFGMKVALHVFRDGQVEDIDVSSNIYDLLPQDDEGISEYYRHSFTVRDEQSGEFATIALKYTSDTKSYYRGYTNLLYNSQGGTHHKMLDQAILDAWSQFDIEGIKSNDVFLGLRGVVAVFISSTEFSSQSKERLTVAKNSLDHLKVLVVDEIVKWLKENEDIRKSLIKRFQEYRASQNKLLARKEIKSLLYVNDFKAGGTVRRSSVVRKLRECDSRTREDTELFIVEGDSAMGSALQARNQRLQAIIPVRGKVLNVARYDDPRSALKNEETRSIINCIGAGIGEESDPERSRYDKIIFMADADPDGLEIGVLLAGMFVMLLPNLVKAGMVYISLPPLYGWKDKKGEYHFTNDQSKIPDNAKERYRYKGLGEMDPDELRTAVMSPETRRLLRLNYPDDLGSFTGILTSSGVKFQMLEDQGVIKYEY